MAFGWKNSPCWGREDVEQHVKEEHYNTVRCHKSQCGISPCAFHPP